MQNGCVYTIPTKHLLNQFLHLLGILCSVAVDITVLKHYLFLHTDLHILGIHTKQAAETLNIFIPKPLAEVFD